MRRAYFHSVKKNFSLLLNELLRFQQSRGRRQRLTRDLSEALFPVPRRTSSVWTSFKIKVGGTKLTLGVYDAKIIGLLLERERETLSEKAYFRQRILYTKISTFQALQASIYTHCHSIFFSRTPTHRPHTPDSPTNRQGGGEVCTLYTYTFRRLAVIILPHTSLIHQAAMPPVPRSSKYCLLAWIQIGSCSRERHSEMKWPIDR